MQAIITKVIPATNTKAKRIKAQCPAGAIIMQDSVIEDLTCIPLGDNLHYTLDCHNHRKLAWELIKKLKWTPKEMHTGDLPNGDYVHVLTF